MKNTKPIGEFFVIMTADVKNKHSVMEDQRHPKSTWLKKYNKKT
jgi:hypothetical protein